MGMRGRSNERRRAVARWVAILSTVKTRPSIRWAKRRGEKRCWAMVGRSPGNDKTRRSRNPRWISADLSPLLSSPFLFFLFLSLSSVNHCISGLPVFINRRDSSNGEFISFFILHPRERIVKLVRLILVYTPCDRYKLDRFDFESESLEIYVIHFFFFFFFFVRYWIASFTRVVKQISDFLWLVPPCVFSIRTNSPFLFFFFPPFKNEL